MPGRTRVRSRLPAPACPIPENVMTPKPRAPRSPRPSRRAMRDLLKPVGLAPPERIRLSATLGSREAGGLRDQLLALRGRPIELEGQDVERVGALGLQVLLSAQATWERDNQGFRLVEASEELAKGLAILGAASLVQAA